jgi:hypothetical protein
MEPAAVAKDDTACPECQGRDLRLRYLLVDPAYHTAECRTCGFAFMHPYPSDQFLNDHYKSRSLYGFVGSDAAAYERGVADRAALIGDLLKRAGITPGGKAVDFGAGVGIAVAGMMRLGYQALGAETNPQAQAVGREVFGADIRDLDLPDLPADLSLFTLFEVLEHIKYPRGFLKAAAGHMNSGAALIGSVPNYNGLSRYLLGKHSIALGWPEHVNQFTRASLRRTLSEAGFDVVYIGFPPPYGVVITRYFRVWLRQVMKPGPVRDGLIGLVTWVKKYLIYPLPNLFAEQTGLLGHGLVFVARKRAG